jgi:hypothetical protein
MDIHRTEICLSTENRGIEAVVSMVAKVARRGFHIRKYQRIRWSLVAELVAGYGKKMSSIWGKQQFDPGVLRD